jgi:hypothetical protein
MRAARFPPWVSKTGSLEFARQPRESSLAFLGEVNVREFGDRERWGNRLGFQQEDRLADVLREEELTK